jgi:hypothetical protein
MKPLPAKAPARATMKGVKQEPSFFDGRDAVLVYIAKRLKDALRLEGVLTEAGVDFGVEADEYRAGVVFRTVRTGAFFYVLPDSVDSAHTALRSAGLTPYVE